jgi:hypothetical protein
VLDTNLPVPEAPRPTPPPAPEPEPEIDPVEPDTRSVLLFPNLDPIVLSDAEGAALHLKITTATAADDDVLRTLLRMNARARSGSKIARLGAKPAAEIASQVEEVRIAEVEPHPRNARQGDIGAIAASMSELGQYRPIVVNRRDSSILVGSHRWMAAKALGWDTISAVFVDVDEEDAVRIMLADNRTSDLGRYDDQQLLDMLVGAGSLDGTGYDLDDLDDLWAKLNSGTSGKFANIIFSMPTENYRLVVKESWRRYSYWFDRLTAEAGRSDAAVPSIILSRLL